MRPALEQANWRMCYYFCIVLYCFDEFVQVLEVSVFRGTWGILNL